ncbi:MAG: 3'-5' exonuclease [Parachlamydiales bacterium]|jgi:DNA polymerase-3 subunit epsilon/oligoribonuclease
MLGIFLDTETNGLNPFLYQVLEIAYQIIDLASGEKKGEYQTVVFHTPEVWEKSNPSSLQINGFTYETIKKGKNSREVEQDITAHFTALDINRKNSVYICQNPSFDRIFFAQIIEPKIQEERLWPYHWLDLASMYWALFVKNNRKIADFRGFSKDAIAKDLKLKPESQPHRAMQGVRHLHLCYEALIGFPEKEKKSF